MKFVVLNHQSLVIYMLVVLIRLTETEARALTSMRPQKQIEAVLVILQTRVSKPPTLKSLAKPFVDL